MYPEYTGTLREEILRRRDVTTTPDGCERIAADDGVAMSEPLGFSNNYALAVRPRRGERLGVGDDRRSRGVPSCGWA